LTVLRHTICTDFLGEMTFSESRRLSPEVCAVNRHSIRLVPRCDESLEEHVTRLADAGPAAIGERLAQIEEEWSVGRVAKVAAGALALGAAAAGLAGRRRTSALLAVTAGGCLCSYLLSRRSVVGDLLCHLGFRQGNEIERERLALRALRGDFEHVPTLRDVESHDDIARFEGEGGFPAFPNERKIDPHEAAVEVLRAV
jgi:hypothetical protein